MIKKPKKLKLDMTEIDGEVFISITSLLDALVETGNMCEKVTVNSGVGIAYFIDKLSKAKELSK